MNRQMSHFGQFLFFEGIPNIDDEDIYTNDATIDLHEEVEILGGKLELDGVTDVDTDTLVLRLRGGLRQLDIS